jgi:hypothetical protein
MLAELSVSGDRAERGHAYGVVGLVLAAVSFAFVACVVVKCYLRRKGSLRRSPHHHPGSAEEEDDAELTV